MPDLDQPTLFGPAPEPEKEYPRWSVIDVLASDDSDEPADGFDEAGNLIGSLNCAIEEASYFTIDAAAREYAEDGYGLLDHETDTYYPPAEWPRVNERLRHARLRRLWKSTTERSTTCTHH
jgi:hypothetical protein